MWRFDRPGVRGHRFFIDENGRDPGCVVILVDGTTDLLRWVIKVIAPSCRGEIIEAKCPHSRSPFCHNQAKFQPGLEMKHGRSPRANITFGRHQQRPPPV
jgi:hypothetical protein